MIRRFLQNFLNFRNFFINVWSEEPIIKFLFLTESLIWVYSILRVLKQFVKKYSNFLNEAIKIHIELCISIQHQNYIFRAFTFQNSLWVSPN